MQDELKTVQTATGGSRRDAVKKFVLKKRKAAEIQRLREKLDGYQRTLDTKIVIDIRRMIACLKSQQIHQNGRVDQKIADISARLASCEISVADNMKTALDRAIVANKLEHEGTRSHIQSHVDRSLQTLTIGLEQQQELQNRQDRFLGSLRFDEINSRRNDIVESSSNTFGWVFEGETSRSWASLGNWLVHGQQIYWVKGKAGAGKSTFMKFLVNDERTYDLLQSWSRDKTCIILDYYFWLSGSKLQRSIKGFLAAIHSQIMSKEAGLLKDVLSTNELMRTKQSISDWSVQELRGCISSAIEVLNHKTNICAFLDGIDEFDQDEDVQDLLHFIEELCRHQRTKICLSSRPDAYIEQRLSNYDKLQLQDLTAGDMKVYINDHLRLAFDKSPQLNGQKEHFNAFTRSMTDKADGVFLWVHFAMKSLIRGMRNEDDLDVLETRLAELPSGMQELYQKMWLRLNEDEQRYRDEATIYFSLHEYFPLSLFQMMVALREDIQRKYLESFAPQNSAEMSRYCERLKTRIMTRCAGLLEVTVQTSRNKPPFERFELVRHSSLGKWTSSLGMGQSADCHTNQDALKLWYEMKVTFIHRTAKDFLFGSKAGQAIACGKSPSRATLFESVTKARMAALLQDLTGIRPIELRNIMESVAEFDTESEVKLISEFRRVCEACNTQYLPLHGGDFTSAAANYGCLRYVQHFVTQGKYVSPYCMGHLFSKVVRLKRPDSLKRLQLATWLVHHGADLKTKQCFLNRIRNPFEEFLSTMLYELIPGRRRNLQHATQVVEFLGYLRPVSTGSRDRRILILPAPPNWLIAPKSTNRWRILRHLHIETEVENLYRYAMWCLGQRGATTTCNDESIWHPNSSMKVLLLTFMDTDLKETSFCLDHEDSISWGQMYKNSIGSKESPEAHGDETAQSLSSPLGEIAERCNIVDRGEWER